MNASPDPDLGFTITLKNRRLSWHCSPHESVIHSAKRQGIELPTSCQNGTCRTCLIPSSKGGLEHLIAWPGLSLEEKAQGALLPCVACPTSDLEVEDSHWGDALFEQAFDLLHEDTELLVLNKPSGLLAVPGKGAHKLDSLSHRVQQWDARALIVHRLDQATSGLMLMARSPQSQKDLSRQFAQRQIDKRYLAKVQATLTPSEVWHTIDAPIYADWSLRPKRVIDALGQPSQTRWRVLHTSGGFSWLELQPLTGRTHQLRVHLSHQGWPIVGDRLYAPESVQALSERLLLHAWTIQLQHPKTQSVLKFEAPPPSELLIAQTSRHNISSLQQL
jgi:tRNA pseudouridine32 synthase/23S rRNA pseudouridine746 synthase